MNGVGSSSSSSSRSPGGRGPFPLSEGRKAILKDLYEDLLKFGQQGGPREPLFQSLSFLLQPLLFQNEDAGHSHLTEVPEVVAEGPVMARFCANIDLGIDVIEVPVGLAKAAVEYFIKTVYLREEAIQAIPTSLFKDVVTLAFSYDALDWEDHVSTSTENLASMLELMSDTSKSVDVRKRATEYVKNYTNTIATGLLDSGQHQRETRVATTSSPPSRSRTLSSRLSSSMARREPPSPNPRDRSRSPCGVTGQRRPGSRDDIFRRNQQLPTFPLPNNTTNDCPSENTARSGGCRGRGRPTALRKGNRETHRINGHANQTNTSSSDEEALTFVGPTRRASSRKANMNLKQRLVHAKPRETITIGPGTYEFKEFYLTLSIGVRIVGHEGEEKTVIKAKPSLQKETFIWAICKRSGKDCVIENLTFEMDGVKGFTGNRTGLFIDSPVTVKNCIFRSCGIELSMNSKDALCVGSTFINSEFGICFNARSHNAIVRNCKFKNIKFGIEIWGNEHKVEDTVFKKVENGILVRGDNAWAKADGGELAQFQDIDTGRGNTICGVKYHFWDEDVEQLGIQLVAAEGNKLSTVTCLDYPKTSTHYGRTANGMQKVGLQIENEKLGNTQVVVTVARNNTILGFTGAPVEVEGENNKFEKLRECPYFRVKGSVDKNPRVDCKQDELIVIRDDGKEVVVPKNEH